MISESLRFCVIGFDGNQERGIDLSSAKWSIVVLASKTQLQANKNVNTGQRIYKRDGVSILV